MAVEVKLEILFEQKKGEPIHHGYLDIYESENLPLSIQYGIKNITNLAESQGAYTKTFDIPATKHNNKLLKHVIRDQKSDVTEFVDESIKCRVSVNGRIVLTGNFTVKSYLKDYKDRGYTISVLGDNNNWTTIMDGKMMCETIDTQLNNSHTWHNGLWHWYNNNRIVDDATYPNGLPTYDVCIPHIAWGEYAFPHSTAGAPTFQSRLEEQTPAFFVKNLIKAYFEEAGYQLISNFMNTKFFKKLIIPTDPIRFNHANYGTLGGGTGAGDEVVLVEANFYNDTGKGNATALHFNATWTGMNYVLNWKWADCDETQTLQYFDPNYPIQTSNHCVGLGTVYSPMQGNPAGSYWMGERITPYNEEIVDGTNTQVVHEHQKCRNSNWANQIMHTNLSIIWGHAGSSNSTGGGVFFFNKHPIVYHNWTCVTTATYTVEVYQSLGLMKMMAALNHARAKVLVQLVMHENLSGHNYTDNTVIHSIGTGGTQTVLADAVVTNSSNDKELTWKYKEVDIVWTGVIPAGAQIYVITSIINNSRGNSSNPFTGRAILMDRDYTQFDCGAETKGMTGTTARETKFRIKTGTGINIGDTVTWHEYLPCDITQKQFIGGLTGLFNLHWWTDESQKKVFVEPYEDFYKERGESVNWTDKIDFNTKHQTKFLTDILNRYALYRYLEPTKDGYQATLNLNLPVPYHAQLVDLGDQYINKTNVYGTDLFGATVMIGDNQLVPLITPTPPWVPLIVQEWAEDVSTSTKPERASGYNLRILSYEGLQTTGDQPMEQGWANQGSGGETDVYPRAVSFMENWVAQSGQTHSHLPYHDNSDTGQEGLFNRFYNTMFRDLIELPRMKIALFHLTPADIAQLDLRRLVYLSEDGGSNGTYWKIHKIIDYQPHKDGLTKVELLQYQIKDNKGRRLTTNGGSTTGNPGDHGHGEEPIDDWITVGTNNTGITHGNNGGILYDPIDDDYGITEDPIGKSLVMAGNQSPTRNGNIVLGNGLIANDRNQIVLGRYNVQTAGAQFIIGGGTSNTDRRNVLTVFKDGSIVMGSDSDNLVTQDSNGDYIDLYTEEDRITFENGKQVINTTINKVK